MSVADPCICSLGTSIFLCLLVCRFCGGLPGVHGARLHLAAELGLVLYHSPFEPKAFHCLLLAKEIILLVGNSTDQASSAAAACVCGIKCCCQAWSRCITTAASSFSTIPFISSFTWPWVLRMEVMVMFFTKQMVMPWAGKASVSTCAQRLAESSPYEPGFEDVLCCVCTKCSH